MSDFVLDEGRFGKVMVVTGPWSSGLVKAFHQSGAREIVLNYAKGWQGDSLGFLADVADSLHGLTVLDWRIADVSAVQDLVHLRHLSLQTSCKTRIDFSRFPELEDLSFYWREGSETVSHCKSLRRLVLHKCPNRDLSILSPLASLVTLLVIGSSIVSTLGVEKLRSLRELELRDLRRLTDLQGIGKLPALEWLFVDGCRRLGALTDLTGSSSLKTLVLWDCGELQSLKPLRQVATLEAINFTGTTKISDGDLSVLDSMPQISSIRFNDRRHYSHKFKYFESKLGMSRPSLPGDEDSE